MPPPEPPRLSLGALVPYPPNTTPSQRYRIEQWRPRIEANGISVDLLPFADARLHKLLQQPGHIGAKAVASLAAFARSAAHVAAARGYDAVLIHRAICLAGPAVLERVVSILGRPVIFDFDDAIFLLHTSDANRGLGWLKFPGKTATICRLSSHVVVGNAWLGEFARRFNPNVTVIPSSVDIDRFRPRAAAVGGGPVVVGWTGSSTSQTYLEMFLPTMRRLAALPGVELRVHSDREPDLPGVPHTWRPWSPETEIDEISQFDVGIMPMPDLPWAQGKCAMKALLYMSLGIPTVCSAIGMNREVIDDGENGFLAATEDEWVARVGDLVRSPELRGRLGAAGRATVEADYSLEACADAFSRVVRAVVAR